MTREGSFSKDGQTVNTETRRQGDKSVTKAEGSGGGRAVSASGDSGRTTIAESGSGDLYAGHNGEVFKKTDDGWQKHGEDGWQDVQKPERPDAGEGNGNFSRDQLDASSRDAARTQATQAGGQGQPGDRAAQNGAGATPRYGGSGSLGGTGSQTGQRSQDMGGGAQARPSYQNYDQLNRDSAARRGGNQSFQQRSSMQRSGGMQRRPAARRR